MRSGNYRDMQLLAEIAQSPHATQRDLSKRIGSALGLTNLMLRRLATKGYIKITSPKRGKIRYLLTRKGFLEKTRLTCEFINYSLHLYARIRGLLHEQLSLLRQAGKERVILCGTDELAEIACLTIQEMGLRLVGVAESDPKCDFFLGHPVRRILDFNPEEYDRFVVVTLYRHMDATQRFVELGVPADRIISVAFRHLKELSLLEGSAEKIAVTTSLDPSVTDVVILCGGLGTRLGALTAQTPKPLLPVGRHPFLLRLLLNLESQGFVRFILAAHYLAEHFKELLSTYRDVLPNITLVVESAPLGTGGALRHALGHVHSSVFVALNGDSWVTQPLEPVLIDHLRAGRVFTVVAVPATNVEGGALNKGVWRVGPKGDVQGFATQGEVSEGWVNAGVYIFDRDLVSSWPSGSYSLEDNLPSLLKGKRTSVFCSTGRLLDIGTPESYERASRVLEPPDQLVSSMGSA